MSPPCSARYERIGPDRLLGPVGNAANRCRDLVVAMIVARLIAPLSKLAAAKAFDPITASSSLDEVRPRHISEKHRHHRPHSRSRVRRAYASNQTPAKGARPPRHQSRYLYPVAPRARPKSGVGSVDYSANGGKFSLEGLLNLNVRCPLRSHRLNRGRR